MRTPSKVSALRARTSGCVTLHGSPFVLTLRPVLPARTASNPKALIGSVGVKELECDEPFEFFERWFHDVASGPLPGSVQESWKRVNHHAATQNDRLLFTPKALAAV